MLAENTTYDTDRMLSMKDVRDRLGLSYAEVINMVRAGRLRAYRYAGSGPISREELSHDTRGLRFRTSDVEEMLERTLIK